jgi:ribosomal protein S17E
MTWKDELKKATTSQIKISSELEQEIEEALEKVLDDFDYNNKMVVENAKSETKRLNNKMELNEQSSIDERYIAMAAIEQMIERMIKNYEDDYFRGKAEFEGDY